MRFLDRDIDHENPETVFRYRPISINSLYEISTSSFYLSKPQDFNDPFDCDFFWKEHSKEDKEDHILYSGNETSETELGDLEKAKSLFEKKLYEDINHLGIACFTTDPCNPLMWSHYADGHKGLCIEYKREGVLKNEYFKKVEYDRDNKLVWSSLDLGKDLNRLNDFFNDVVFRKLSYWLYEKEWRVMAISPKRRLIHMSSPVVSIIFGLKCPSKEIDKVLNIIRFNFLSGVTKVYVMRRSQTGGLFPIELKLE